MATEQTPGWTFLSNHSHVLVCLAADGDLTLREVAARVGVTERAVQRIVSDLELAGVLERTRDGRRNTYRIDASVPLRHPLEAHCRIGSLLSMVTAAPATRAVAKAPPIKARPAGKAAPQAPAKAGAPRKR
ncbi:MAG: AsnC family transcriptional regulator [Lysobacteraceae bacterium]|nr:MAG: AsnC family transcriptional regulator [Xanthomonadaceae bacterium]